MLFSARIETPLGEMVAVGDACYLYMLDFAVPERIDRHLKRLPFPIQEGMVDSIESIEWELGEYFQNRLMHFHTEWKTVDSPFQKEVWNQLTAIPFGETLSYLEVAQAMEKPEAVRAVASAIGANMLALVIPCHRVIRSNGELGNYGGEVWRKERLYAHEGREAAVLR